MKYSAVDLADLLRRPRPTIQQQAVIEAPLEPMLVVAGAGSGKTATMTDRVVWLVANDLVAPSEVLGLTFTRKAAAELAGRVERHLRAFTRRVDPGAASSDWIIERPRISTYNAYAAALVTEHGVRLGLESDVSLLSEAGRYQLAERVLRQWEGPLELSSALSTVVSAIVALAGELAEHLLLPEEAADKLELIAAELAGAAPTPRTTVPYAPVREVMASLRDRVALMPLVAAFTAAKRERGVMDFPDQVAAAARLASMFPAVVQREREAARVVLLDEYQDTSVAQLELLRHLFGAGHAVTAVGDPHQGIYGWRGASAGALMSFPEQFPRSEDSPAPVAHLTTSWRNDSAILAAANVTSAPLSAGSAVAVPPLEVRPGAGPGVVEWAVTLDEGAEAAVVAAMFARHWRPGQQTAAVLCRKRSQFEQVRNALADANLPHQVVGLAGLLRTPEVSDVVSALQAAHDPARGEALMRLLTGPAFRLGAADLMALGALAGRRTRGSAGVGQPREDSDDASIIEALEVLPRLSPEAGEGALADGAGAGDGARGGHGFTAAGLERLHRARELLREVRAATHLALPDLVVATEQLLGLDVEVAAHGDVAGRGRADLDQLAVVADQFEATTASPTLGAFLAWLETADDVERGLEVSATEPDPGCVQILTMHAAKGLEWDMVAVVGLTEQDFPGLSGKPEAPTNSGWTKDLCALPYEMRGDAAHLPELEMGPEDDHRDVRDALEQFRRDDGDRQLREERRLAYVAFTRARSRLLLTACWWSGRTTANAPSRFLLELVRAGVATGWDGATLAELESVPERPAGAADRSALWPPEQDARLDSALAQARDLIAGVGEVAAREQRIATSPSAAMPLGLAPPAPEGEPDDDVARWRWQVWALLTERERVERDDPIDPPEHLSASAVVALATDPVAFARERRRPLPQRPSHLARRGTQFHAWLEQRYATAALLDVADLAEEREGSEEEDLAHLQEAFLASSWADREPIAVEADVETPVAGVQVRCRIDAVFPGAAGEDCDVHIVDWKTGEPAHGEKARAARELQLALYRLGWARLHGVPIERVAASFHFVTSGLTHSAPRLGEEEVERLLEHQFAQLQQQG